MKNETKYCVVNALWPVCLMFVSGTILQSFMLECGMEEAMVQRFVSIMQIIQCLVTVAFSARAEKIKHVIGFSAITYLMHIPMMAVLCLMSIKTDMQMSTKYLLLFSMGTFSAVSLGFYNILLYKVPYHIINMKEYGKRLSINGMASGIFGAFFSFVLSACLKRGEFFFVMTGFHFLVFGFVILCGVTEFSYQKREPALVKKKESSVQNHLFSYKPFLHMVIPNLLRGFSMGIFNIMATVGYYFGIIDSGTVGILTVVGYVTTIVSCLLYARFSVKRKEGKLILICSVVVSFCMACMLIGKNLYVFLLFYGIASSAFYIVNSCVPVLVTQIVDYGILGRFTAWRMLLHTAGTAMAGFVCTPMLEMFGGILTMIIVATLNVCSGILYFVCARAHKQPLA